MGFPPAIGLHKTFRPLGRDYELSFSKVDVEFTLLKLSKGLRVSEGLYTIIYIPPSALNTFSGGI